MKTRHTPLPWRYSKEHLAIVSDCYPDWADQSDPDQEKITKVCTILGTMGGHDVDADIAVMTAAPELLAALQRLLEWVDPYAVPGCDENEEDVEAARAAIAKATGA